jgi:hypothetical protein
MEEVLMDNKKAKQLMFGCIKSRENGECYVVEKVSIKTANLKEGSTVVYSRYIGDLDSSEVLNNIEDFCRKLGL